MAKSQINRKFYSDISADFPDSAGFWNLAAGYRDAGDSTLATLRSPKYCGNAMVPCVFLYFRSIELALKAVLVGHNVPKAEIKTLGHRISALIVRCESFTTLDAIGVELSDRDLLDRFSKDYSGKMFEYSDDFWTYHRSLEDLQSVARRICEKVQWYSGK